MSAGDTPEIAGDTGTPIKEYNGNRFVQVMQKKAKDSNMGAGTRRVGGQRLIAKAIGQEQDFRAVGHYKPIPALWYIPSGDPSPMRKMKDVPGRRNRASGIQPIRRGMSSVLKGESSIMAAYSSDC